MDVQAQYYPSVVAPFTPNYPPRKAPRLAGSGAAPFFHAVAQLSNLPSAFLPQQQALIHGTTAFSGDPESDLTCNASGSRKRAFMDGGVAHATFQRDLHQQQRQQKTRPANVPQEVASLVEAVPVAVPVPAASTGTPSSLQVSCDEIRLNDSAMASTSGKPTSEAPVPAISPLMEEVVSQLCQQSLEVEAFIRLQNERIRSRLENARKRHHRALLWAMEQGVLRRLREKDTELEFASRRNADLEEKLRRLAAENQILFSVARNNEAIVSSLRATLDQVLFQNTAAASGAAILPAQCLDWEEGWGESDCVAPVVPAEDAHSCCYEGASAAAVAEAKRDTAAASENLRDLQLRRACRVCGKREVAVVLLPCRHLCLCRQCDPGVGACPVCDAAKHASVQVFMC